MSKALPDLASRFRSETQAFLDILGATEGLWITAPPTSEVRRQLKVGQLEALYEAVYLRIFASWETMLEDLTVYFLAGYRSSGYTPRFATPRPGNTLTASRAALYGTRDYLLWHRASTVATRVSSHLVGCPVETVVDGSADEIDRFAAVRHAIAHASVDARAKFRAASMVMTGYEHKAPGRFLRSEDVSDPLNPSKRILVIRNRLVDLVTTMGS